jgi:hypothetical protein
MKEEHLVDLKWATLFPKYQHYQSLISSLKKKELSEDSKWE